MAKNALSVIIPLVPAPSSLRLHTMRSAYPRARNASASARISYVAKTFGALDKFNRARGAGNNVRFVLDRLISQTVFSHLT